MNGTATPNRLISSAMGLWRGRLARQAIWLTVPFGLQQGVRLVTNVILARLLAPEMFGIMLLINTMRTGMELLSDIGIGQSVVRSQHSADPVFLDTAWTVQLMRGVLLALVALAAAAPIAHAYNNASLLPIFSLVSLGFLLTGLQSPDIFLMQRDMRLGQRGVYDVVCAIVVSAITVVLAIMWGNIWALVWGLVLGMLFSTAMTFAFAPFRIPKPTLHRKYLAEILHFGKWIFLATAVYFASMSTDRIYFAAVLPLSLVGVYGVARTFADLLVALAQRLGGFLVFPKVVELRNSSSDIAASFRHNRRLALGGIALAMTVALVGSDRLVLTLYDARYHAAAFMLPVLLVSVWFSVLASFGESALLGLDRPKAGAFGNVAKFGVLIVGLPFFVPQYGIFAGLIVLLVAEASRWLAISIALRSERMGSLGDDLGMTVAIAAGAVVLKWLLGFAGLVPTFQQWWALGATVHG
ncbi:oligosaccharide flippase family protein [Sphingomonas panacisoli]|uniref:Oligosaccharide flippase family protein n=1 Tax=Sphingomonas panacisoli TaxID=1813879 RepID=A0A5B8LIQ5_9SPHN|nr:oligosaccharide flippase family protein [Sphingomonas panacisoli]QDZ08053.1 oligosaccharide flippase family protein [Sphingomonas panacisoli]